MPIVFHSLIGLAYATLSAALAVGLPNTSAAVDPTIAILAGALLLLGSGLIHQSLTHLVRSRDVARELGSVSENSASLQRRIEDARGDLQELKRAFQVELARQNEQTGDETAITNQEAMGELRLLRTLFSQLTNARKQTIENDADTASGRQEIDTAASEGEPPAEAVTGNAGHKTDLAASDSTSIYQPVPARSEYRADWASGGGRAAAATQAAPLEHVGQVGPAIDGLAQDHATAAVATSTGPDENDILQVMRDALERARVSLFLQPVVKLPNRKVTYYEVFSRIRDADGVLIGPQQYIELAERAGLIGAIDNHLFFRCVQLLRRVRRHNRDYGFFCNMSPHTLTDEAFFPQFLDFLAENDDLSQDLIFEFSQADVMLPHGDFETNLGKLAELGFRFSLDRVANFHQDYHSLSDRHFRYVKFEAARLLDMAQEEHGDANVEALIGELHEARINLIVEKIETERELVELLDHNIPYGQGYLFGEPRESKSVR